MIGLPLWPFPVVLQCHSEAQKGSLVWLGRVGVRVALQEGRAERRGCSPWQMDGLCKPFQVARGSTGAAMIPEDPKWDVWK